MVNKPPYVLGASPERDRTWVLYCCRNSRLLKNQGLHNVLERSLNKSGIETYGGLTHKFGKPGDGVTAVVIVGASRADAHCWPEVGTLVLGCFSCGDKDRAVHMFVHDMIKRARPSKTFEIQERTIHVVMPEIIPSTWTPVF